MAINIAPSATPTPTAPRIVGRRLFWLSGLLVAIVVFSYALAWLSAYRLSQGYLQDADSSYDSGEYLNALVGYREFDDQQQRYIDRGGYMEVERIWGDRYAQPVPPDVARARQRIDEIINERLAVGDAEAFVQQNIGRSNPYLALLYLRLGELYEADDRIGDATDIYSSFGDLFSNEVELAARAQQNLERLENS